jgi:hypothetical protein
MGGKRDDQGLQGKRIALLGDRDRQVAQGLQGAGATVESLDDVVGDDPRWHSATHAALVVMAGLPDARADRAVQLIRECLLADKPVAAYGSAVALLLTSGGVAGRTIAADPSMDHMLSAAGATPAREPLHDDAGIITARGSVAIAEFVRQVASRVGERFLERRVDEMSDMSFPASDPPATTPATAGPAPADRERRA